MTSTYKTGYESITSKFNGSKLVFPFLEKPKTININLIKAYSIHTHHINVLIFKKQTQLMHPKQDVLKKKIEQ